MKTKEEVIKEAYGEDYEKLLKKEYGIDDEGFSNFYEHGNETFLHGYEIFCGHSVKDIVKVRPLGLGEKLENLKNNNGWVKIQSEDDLPKDEENLDYWVMEDEQIVHAKFMPESKRWYCDIDLNLRLFPSHYQPMVKPKTPLY